MIRRVVIAAGVALLASTAHAGPWSTKTGEDPMSDQKWAAASVDNGHMSVLIKCWDGSPGRTVFALVPGVRFDPAAKYKDKITLKFRADKGDPISFEVTAGDVNGFLTLGGNDASDVPTKQIINSISDAKTRLAVAFGEQVQTFPVKGAAAALKRLKTTCSMD